MRGRAWAARIRQHLPARFSAMTASVTKKAKFPKTMQRPALREIGARNFRSNILRLEKANVPTKASFLGIKAQQKP
jgi:hypothetical protein